MTESPRFVDRTLVRLRHRVDDHFGQAQARDAAAIVCRPGCSQCCQTQLSVFAVEAARIATALSELEARAPTLRAQTRMQGRDPTREACALLVDDRCAIYDERPLICRSHGVPVALPADDAGQVAVVVCPQNYRDTEPPAASILVLEAINAPLAVLARMWDGSGERVSLAALAAAD